MEFSEASNALFERISHKALGDELGISVAAIRQARLDPNAKAFRSAPKNWRKAVIALAEARIRRLHELIGALENEPSVASRSSEGQ